MNDPIDAVLEAAPHYPTLTQASRSVNESLGLEWSDAKWRGIWKSNPGKRFLAQKKLGTAHKIHVHGQKLALQGDMRGVTVADTHAPYHDPRAIELACKVIEWWKPAVIVHNGDNVDFSGISKFDSNPARRFTTQDEVDIWQCEVAIPLNEAAGAKSRKLLLPGNHDLRFLKLMWQQPELFSLRSLSLPVLFQAEELGMEYVGYGVTVNDALFITHGTKVSQQSGYSGRAELAALGYSYSTNTGHVHRAGRHEFRTPTGRVRVGQECPCLCGLSPEYIVAPNWVQGLTLWQTDGDNLWIYAVTFTPDYTCLIAGKKFSV
jgi:hypothetical protein